MYGWDVEAYQKRISAFGWETLVVDGHDYTRSCRPSTGQHRRRKDR